MRNPKFKLARGFTLVEILVTAAILAFSLCGLLASYTNMFLLADLVQGFTLTTNTIQAKMEEIKKTNFDSLLSLNKATFDLGGFASSDGKGVIEVTNTAYSDLRRVRIIACFRIHGRIIGEDKNLDGNLSQGEDTLISNGRLDSPLELITLIAR